MTASNTNDELTRELDSIQRDIWVKIADEVNVRGVKLSYGDAYCMASVIKEVLHPRVKALLGAKQAEALLKLKEEMKMHTVPEGVGLITRSYLNRSIDFMVGELKGKEKNG